MAMKTTAYILLLIAATALIACNDDEVTYVRQDQLAIKTFPITSVGWPRLLPDGSLITIEESDNRNSTIARGSNANDSQNRMSQDYAFRFTRLTKDGTMSYSPDYTFNISIDGNQHHSADDEDDYYNFEVTPDGGSVFRYCNPSGTFALATFDGGTIVNTDLSEIVSDLYIGCAPLSNSAYAVIHGTNPVISILENGEWIDPISLPYLHCDESSHYKVYGLCGNIMIMCVDEQKTEHEFYVYSPVGELLNYGSVDYVFEDIITISDPSSNALYGYAIISDADITTDDDNTERGSIIIKLDYKGSTIYEYQTTEISDVYNINHYNGTLMIAGTYMSMSMDISNINDIARVMTTTTGKIISLDAESLEQTGINTISLEGGVIPFAVVPDDGGGYYVYMSRIMTSDVGQMGSNSEYGNSIYIYHTDDLNKLNIE